MEQERTPVPDTYWICPLYSFSCTIKDLEPIDLGGGVAIWRMPPQVRDRIDRNDERLALGINLVDWAIRIPQNIKRWKTTETVMDNIHDQISSEAGLLHDMSELTVDLLTTLRVLHKGAVALGPLLKLDTDNRKFTPRELIGLLSCWFPLSRTELLPGLGETAYQLLETEVDTLREFWLEFQDKRLKGKISDIRIALRRFNSSYGEHGEDRLIDHMIALESLYLGKEQELGYKLALRAGFLLGRTENERKEIFKRLKKAYTDRGKIVHGGKPRGNLSELVADTEEYLRQSIKRFIKLSDQYTLKHLRDHLLDENIIEAGELLRG